MALEVETKKVVSQFDISDQDVNAATLEFLRQMGKLETPPPFCWRPRFLSSSSFRFFLFSSFSLFPFHSEYELTRFSLLPR